MFGVYFKNQKGSVMKKVLSKIFVIFAFCFSFTETRIQQASAKLRNVFVKALLWC